MVYLKWYKHIEETQWLSKEELVNYQWEKVRVLLEYSYNNIPYYTKMFKSIDSTPKDINSWSDFEKIPFLTKEQVKENPDDFISVIAKKNEMKISSTGGSSGQPLAFYRNPIMDTIERAFMFHQWGRVGFKEKSTRVILRAEALSNGRLFKKHRFQNVWVMSSYQLSGENINEYVRYLNKIKPDFFHVYPTSFYIFTQLLIQTKNKLEFPIKAILCGSEPVHDYQRELFENTYQTRVYSWLGLAEGVVLAGGCEHSNSYHVWPQHSYVELIDEYGKPVRVEGKQGEIVGTTINNFDSPFIRYRTGDIGTYTDEHCPKCGRNFEIIENIDGRKQDEIILRDERRISMTAITFGLHFEAYRKINKMQIVQEKKGEIVLFISVLQGIVFNNDDENEIRNKMINAAEGELIIDFIYTDNLKRTKSGKHIYFIQELTFT